MLETERDIDSDDDQDDDEHDVQVQVVGSVNAPDSGQVFELKSPVADDVEVKFFFCFTKTSTPKG